MGVIPPPHVIRLEFDKDIAVDDVIADKESAFDFRWKQVAPRVIEVRFSGPAMSPARSVVAAIFAKGNPEFQVKAVRRFTVASGARGISSDQHPKE